MSKQYVTGTEELIRRLRFVGATFAVPVVVEEVTQALYRRTLERFDAEEDPEGNRWTPLADSTLARRKRAGGKPGKPILVQTEDLRASIKIIRGLAAGLTYTNTGVGSRIGVSDPDQVRKARTHQNGYSARGIPQRRFLGFGAADDKIVLGVLQRISKEAGL